MSNQVYHSNENKNNSKNRTLESNKNQKVDKYKRIGKKGEIPKGQFKKYILEASNVFYEDREQLHRLSRIVMTRNILLILWLILGSSYLIIRAISPYNGKCPRGAECGVFVRCP